MVVIVNFKGFERKL